MVKNKMQQVFNTFLKKARRLESPSSRIPPTAEKAKSVLNKGVRKEVISVLAVARTKLREAAKVAAVPGDPDRVSKTVVTGREARKKLCTV